MVYITRRETFNAAHRLYNEHWTAEKNWEVFGPCSRIHGHNWELFATVKGEMDKETGFIINFKELSKIMKKHVTEVVDHTFLNEDVAFMKGKLPSTENFIVEIWKILQPVLATDYGLTLHKLKLVETANHYAEYYGE